MAKKITKKEVINTMLADVVIKENPMYVEFLTHELELLDNKAKKKTDSPNAKENELIKEVILETLARINKGTVTELQMANEKIGLDKYRNQRISAILKKMCEEDNTVIKVTENRKSVFYLNSVKETDVEVEETETETDVEVETE
jgi:hypothetical protein